MRLALGSGFLIRLGVFVLLWWILTQGDLSSLGWGMPVVLLTAWLTAPSQVPLWRWRWHVLLRLLPRFLLLSARGGWEVAVLALSPKQQLNTRLVNYTWDCLPPGASQLFMASLINLIPGTLTLKQRSDQKRLYLHILNYRPATMTTLQRLEIDIADLYGLPVNPDIRRRHD